MSSGKILAQSRVPCCDLTESENLGDWRYLDGPHNYNNTYEDMVEEYTKRQMSYASDGLNAIRGMLNLLHKEHDVRFICGLPMKYLFSRFLLWSSVRTACRREGAGGEALFPSWSWAGWQGEAVYPILTHPDGVDQFELASSSAHTGTVDEISDWRIQTGTTTSPIVPAEFADDVMGLDTCLLIFSAESSSHFEIFEERYGKPLGDSSKKSTCYPIVINDKHCGCLIPHHTRKGVQPMHSEFPGLDMTFIALSRGEDRWTMWYPIDEDDLESDSNAFFDIGDARDEQLEHMPFDGNAWSVRGMVVNVLLVYWEGGIAYRAGVGQVHADAWEMAERKKVEVILG